MRTIFQQFCVIRAMPLKGSREDVSLTLPASVVPGFLWSFILVIVVTVLVLGVVGMCLPQCICGGQGATL